LENAQQLLQSWQLRDDMVVVETYIKATNNLYPSFEAFVPPKNEGLPKFEYISNQLFDNQNEFIGVTIDESYGKFIWYNAFYESGMAIAQVIQDLGYVGFFDLDAIVDVDNKVWLLEINARRTGGSRAHSFAVNYYGTDYSKYISILSKDNVLLDRPIHVDEALATLSPILYAPKKTDHGVVVTVSSSLSEARLGLLLIGRDLEEVSLLNTQLEQSLKG